MSSSFKIFLPCVLFSIAAISFGQNTTLSFRPLRAEWSVTLQRIVMVSTAPDQLHLFHPVARTVESIALSAAPQSLSISPNGLFAAVGHAGATTYVDLSARSVVRRFTYSFPATGYQHGVDAVLGNEWLYVLGPEKNEALTIRLSTGAITRTLQQWAAGGLRRLHPDGTALYTMPSSTVGVFSRHSISTGGNLGPSSNSPYFGVRGSNQYAGGLWFSPDGKRIYAGHGGIARYHPDAARDMARLGQFYSAPVRSLSEAAGRIAVIPSLASTPGSTGTEAADNTVILIAADNFRELGRLAIPEFPEGAHGHGRWVFFNNAGSALHVVYELQSTAGFAVQTYELGNPSPCTATFSAFDMTVGSEGALRTADIAAAGNCLSTRYRQPIGCRL